MDYEYECDDEADLRHVMDQVQDILWTATNTCAVYKVSDTIGITTWDTIVDRTFRIEFENGPMLDKVNG